MILGNYKIDVKKLNRAKKEAKKNYIAYQNWCKEKNYRVPPPEIGCNEVDFKLCYKTNGLIKFNGFQLTILKTKEVFYIN